MAFGITQQNQNVQTALGEFLLFSVVFIHSLAGKMDSITLRSVRFYHEVWKQFKTSSLYIHLRADIKV